MNKVIRRIDLKRKQSSWQMLHREWLVTNGLGGYASGTISGIVTRRYHGLLIAALPAPMGRVMMLNHLAEFIRVRDGRLIQIGGEEVSEPGESPQAGHFVSEFQCPLAGVKRTLHGVPQGTREGGRQYAPQCRDANRNKVTPQASPGESIRPRTSINFDP